MIEILLALTPADYSHLARAVQVEAVPNTMDEYCVAASILNRVASPYYPSTVENVIYATGQYEGFQYKMPTTANETVVSRLKDKDKI